MACTYSTYELYKKYFENKLLKYGELGAQFVCEGPWGSYGPPYFKDVFSDLNIVTFDLSGENNSLKLNLSLLLSEQRDFLCYKNYFDVLTNFGTSEHVQNQYNCWKNIFDLLKIDGVIIVDLPHKNSWKGHCKFYYDVSTLLSFNKDFELVEYNKTMKDVGQTNCTAVMKKINNKEFCTQEIEIMNNLQIIEGYIDLQGA